MIRVECLRGHQQQSNVGMLSLQTLTAATFIHGDLHFCRSAMNTSINQSVKMILYDRYGMVERGSYLIVKRKRVELLVRARVVYARFFEFPRGNT